MKILILLAACLSTVLSEEKCYTTANCPEDKCCLKKTYRDSDCYPYRKEGDSCTRNYTSDFISYRETFERGCPCEEGLTCVFPENECRQLEMTTMPTTTMGMTCQISGDCPPGQCCMLEPKRDDSEIRGYQDIKQCQPYSKVGEYCFSKYLGNDDQLYFINSCPCAPGLNCSESRRTGYGICYGGPTTTAPCVPGITVPTAPDATTPAVPEITTPCLPEVTAPAVPEATMPDAPGGSM